MYEKEIKNIPIHEGNSNCSGEFNFSEFQARKRILTEEGLKVSNRILDCLLGIRPEEIKEGVIIDSFMTDLEAEYDTIKELYENLVWIATLLGKN